jgi:hypothetical protein
MVVSMCSTVARLRYMREHEARLAMVVEWEAGFQPAGRQRPFCLGEYSTEQSAWGDSNPRHNLGRVGCYRYTTGALRTSLAKDIGAGKLTLWAPRGLLAYAASAPVR